MKVYKPRKIEFCRIVTANSWNVKVYSITHKKIFKSIKVLNNAVLRLSYWVEKSKLLGMETHNTAFLIVHEGHDGIWTLLNWWVGENMLQSVTFFTSLDDPDEFEETPKEGGMACVWELEVIEFERKTWIDYILKKANKPDFAGYLNQRLNGEF